MTLAIIILLNAPDALFLADNFAPFMPIECKKINFFSLLLLQRALIRSCAQSNAIAINDVNNKIHLDVLQSFILYEICS